MSSAIYPQQGGQGRENTSHKSWSGKTPPPFYLHAQSKFSTKQKWRNGQSNLYLFCNKQPQNGRPHCFFIRKKFWAIKSDFEYGYLLGWFDMADFILILLTWNRRSSCWPPSGSSRNHFHPSRLGSRVWKIVLSSKNIFIQHHILFVEIEKRVKEGSGDILDVSLWPMQGWE